MTENEGNRERKSRADGRVMGSGRKRAVTVGVFLLLVVLLIGFSYRFIHQRGAQRGEAVSAKASKSEDAESKIATLVESEDWILSKTTELPRLARGVLNMQLPDVQANGLFAERITVMGLQPDAKPVSEFSIPRLDVFSQSWPLAEVARTGAPDETGLWTPLFETLSYFERAKFYFVKAKFTNDARTEIHADVNFDGVARTLDGKLMHIKAKQGIDWKKPEGAGEEAWRIASWHQKSLTTTLRDQTFFRDVVHEVIPAELRQQVRDSAHERMLIELAGSSKPEPHRYFSPHASDRHPSTSVVDIDRDGFDDLYVMDQWGPNLLFRNRGDGTFEEIASRVGLDIKDHCSSAIFADFDNDGDSDLFLGRTLQRSMYLENENGQFTDRSKSNVATDLPYLVFSISAADYNADGLMDVLFCTYASETQQISKPNPGTERWLEEFLPARQAEQLYQLRTNHHLLERAGPPNVLLVNRGGGKFDLAPESKQIAAWRHSTQGTWSDFDDDGDLDLYISNDFSPNMMFRNDGPAGFTDVTKETGTADIGFGMGVSWGDFDLDGQQDLYVSNMYSKAGQRITSQLESGDPRFADMARGNSLFRNLNGSFTKVSGVTAPALQVEEAGWSWGGQFVDFDNDCYPDIYALSGFYTAPKQYALPGDL